VGTQTGREHHPRWATAAYCTAGQDSSALSGPPTSTTATRRTFNGLFTGTMLTVWNHGKFQGDYTSFHKEIVKRMPREQTPNHFLIGPANPAYDRQRPFTVK
jgi:hypothetical protein